MIIKVKMDWNKHPNDEDARQVFYHADTKEEISAEVLLGKEIIDISYTKYGSMILELE